MKWAALTMKGQRVSLSLADQEDYLVVFSDGSVFYSVPDPMKHIIQRFVDIYHRALEDYDHAMACEYDPVVPPSPCMEMAAAAMACTAAAAPTPVDGKPGQSCSLSLALPDGILDWDETVLTKFIEEAVGPSVKSKASTPVGSVIYEKASLSGRHDPYPPPSSDLARKGAIAATIGSGWGRESDHQSDTSFEGRGGFRGSVNSFDPSGRSWRRG